MRISDWSSYVCSSDLRTAAAIVGGVAVDDLSPAAAGGQAHAVAVAQGRREMADDDDGRQAGRAPDPGEDRVRRRVDQHPFEALQQIGGASCTERVGQYVYI